MVKIQKLLLVGIAATLASAALAGEPAVAISRNRVNFPSVAQGTASAPEKVGVTNSGTADLSITSIAITGENLEDFSETSSCPTAPAVLGPSATCTIDVTFRPTNVSTLTALLTITDNASGSPRSIILTGTATAPAPAILLSPTAVGFGPQAVNTGSAAHVVVLSNGGGTPLSITSDLALSGPNAAEFTIVPGKTTCPMNAGQVPPKGSCEIAVTFTPRDLGARVGQLVIMDDAAGSPHAVSLSGTGVPAPPAKP